MKSLQTRKIRGLAFLEAILFVPVWVLLLVGLFYVTRATKTLLELRSEARECAHRIALSGCSFVPDECQSEEVPPAVSDEAREVTERGKSRLRTTRISTPTNDAVEGALEVLAGRRFLVSREKSLERPALFGGDEVALSRTVRMPCAPKLKTPEDSAFGTMGLLGGGF